MDKETAMKIVQRRIDHLNKRIQSSKGSEKALSFDAREKEALEFLIAGVTPLPMAEEIQHDDANLS